MIKKIRTFCVAVIFISNVLYSQRGKQGAFTVTANNTIVNSYTALTNNPASGTSTLLVNNSALNTGTVNYTYPAALGPGDLVMIIQMYGAAMDINTYPTTAGWGQYTVPDSWFVPAAGNNSTPWEWGRVTQLNNAGRYEVAEVRSVTNSTTINLMCPLQYSYTAASKVQVIRIPRYTNLTLNANTSIIPTEWLGTTGGVVAIEVNGNLVINSGAKINATGSGFRGAASSNAGAGGSQGEHTNPAGTGNSILGSTATANGGQKGEGIGGFSTEYAALYSTYGRGAPANGGGGGGNTNSGGGGGCNVGSAAAYNGKGVPSTTLPSSTWNLEVGGLGGSVSPGGGRGGYSLSTSNQNEGTLGPNKLAWSGDCRKENGGFGGHPLSYEATRLFMGGGGGAGDEDNNQGGAGGDGGGIVFVTCYGNIIGTGSMEADGLPGQNTNPNNEAVSTLVPSGTNKKGNDGAGGAGGGGFICIKNMNPIPNTISLLARGGNGGNQVLTIGIGASDEASGPGGGGGGGCVAFTSGTPVQSVIGGNAGTTNSSHVNAFNVNGATGGAPGLSSQASAVFNIIALNDTICSGSSTILSASIVGTSPGGTLSWYTTQFGQLPSGSGSTFTTPVLTATTTYYVGICPGTFRVPVTVVVNQPVAATFTQISPICTGGTINLPTTSNNGFTGTWVPAVNNQTTTQYTFNPSPGECATSANMTVTVNPGTEPTFTNPGPVCQGIAFTLPTTSNNGITGTWSPAVNTSQTTLYEFTPGANQCADSASMTVTINSQTTPTFTQVNPICSGGAVNLPASSLQGITGTWSPAVNNTQTTQYSFTPTAGQCASSNATMTVTVNQPTVATFNPIAPICSGGSVNLPATSAEGFTGVWSPAPNNAQTTTYTFTPTAGQCASAGQATVSVGAPVTPTFAPQNAVCSGGSVNLPIASNEGFTGTWSPAPNNIQTTTYTFSPAVGQCATSAQLSIAITQPSTPTFTAIAPVCSGDPINLPGTSGNGFTGTWSPPVNNTQTTQYTFTPDAGQCAASTNLTVNVNPIVTPTFNQVPATCSGTSFSLPGTSLQNITGTWSPPINNTQTTQYTFLPTAGQCASSNTTMTVTINQPVDPTFPTYGPFCLNAILAQVMLPETSNNGISGTWNPGMLSTALAGNTNYTFTPTAGQCANVYTMSVLVNPNITPTFNPILPICSGDNLALPTTSIEAIQGNWTPAINNQSTTAYTFIPTGSTCALETTMTVTVNSPVTPNFSLPNGICSGDPLSLPPSSNENISGVWTPAANNLATTAYTFTPDAGQCASSTSLTVSVNQPVVPTFVPIDPICEQEVFTLPTTSVQGITGSWSPVENNLQTTTYTFLPDAGQCSQGIDISVIVNPAPSIDSSALFISSESCDQENGQLNGLFIAGGTSPYTYEWNGNPSLNTIDLTGVATGTYDFSVTDANGCSDQATFVIGAVSGPFIDFTALVVVQPTCLQGGQISGLLTGGVPNLIFEWTGTNQQTLNINDLTPGSYSLTVTDGNNCTETFGPVILTAPQAPDASFTYSPDEPMEGESVAFNNTSTASGSFISTWTIESQEIVSENVNFSYSEEGTYTVWLNIVDQNGCEDSVSALITVFGQLIIPNVITANGDQNNDLFVIQGLKSNSTVQIYNRWGELVFESTDYQNDWDGKDRSGLDLTEGVYTYLLLTQEGEIKHGFVHLER